MSKPRKTSSSPERLAALFADGPSRPPTIGEMIERDSDGWQRLLRAVRTAEASPNDLSESDHLRLEQEIRAALPTEFHLKFIRYGDAFNATETIAQEAAFLVGLEFGRRTGGVR